MVVGSIDLLLACRVLNIMTNSIRVFFIFCLTSICLVSVAEAQVLDKKSESKLEEAKKMLRTGNPSGSLKILEDLAKKYPCHPEVQLRRAAILNASNQSNKAIDIYEEVLRCNVGVPEKTKLDLSRMYAEIRDYENACKYYDQYIGGFSKESKISTELGLYEKNIRFRRDARRSPVVYKPKLLNHHVNTEWNEFLPVISADGQTLLFTRRERGRENIMLSRLTDGDWGPAVEMTEVGSAGDEAATALSANGDILFVTACYRKDGLGSCDLYYSVKQNGLYTTPKNMGRKINSTVWDGHATLSADGKLLIFSSNRVGTVGMKDLWYCTLNDDSQWSVPRNMGPVINSTQDEDSPFLHQDGKTLYFRSNGHQGMGSYDLFVSRYDNKTGTWSKPENLGYPINDENDQGSLIIALDGKTAYLATDAFATSAKNLDIIQFELPVESRAAAMSYARLEFYDKSSQLPVGVSATINKLGVEEINTNTIAAGEKWLICMEKGQEYALFAEANGYLPLSLHFSLRDEYRIFEPVEKKIYLEKIPDIIKEQSASAPIILENIFFETGKSDLLETSLFEIEKVVSYLISQDGLAAKIVGHTDNTGNADANMKLSHDRAQSVKDALVSRGIDSHRLYVEGKGQSLPIADNNTAEGRSKNRRTEIIFFVQ